MSGGGLPLYRTLGTHPIVWGQRIMNAHLGLMTMGSAYYALASGGGSLTDSLMIGGGLVVLSAAASVYRGYSRRWCLHMEMLGNGVDLNVHTVDWIGRVRSHGMRLSQFVSTNSSFPPDRRRFWLIAHYQRDDGFLDHLILDRAGSAPNVRLLNCVLSGKALHQ